MPQLRADQARIAKTLSTSQVVALAMGRRWGKTVLGEVLCLTFAARGGKVAWVVPSYKNGRPLWRMVRRTLGALNAAGLVHIKETERTVEFGDGVGDGFLGMYTGDDNCDAMRGEDFDLVIVDEAAMLSEIAWTDAILPSLADRAGRAMLISTPRGRNWFWLWWQRGQDSTQSDVRSFTAPSSDNPNPRIQRAALLAQERVSDRTYRQEWLAEFLDDAGGVFHGVRACMRRDGKLFERNWHRGSGHFAIGLDLAKYHDYTVAVVVDLIARRVVGFARWNQESWPLQKERIRQLSAAWDDPVIYMDATGVGDPIYDDLTRSGLRVEPFVLTAASKPDLIENAVLLVEQESVTYPDVKVEPRLQVFINELEAYEYHRTTNNRLIMNAPSGAHDDCVIAFALACWPLALGAGGMPQGAMETMEILLEPASAFHGADFLKKVL